MFATEGQRDVPNEINITPIWAKKIERGSMTP